VADISGRTDPPIGRAGGQAAGCRGGETQGVHGPRERGSVKVEAAGRLLVCAANLTARAVGAPILSGAGAMGYMVSRGPS